MALVLLASLAWPLLAGAADAEAVRIEHLGLQLIGNLETAGGDTTDRTVILIVHDALSLHGADGPRGLQAALAARGRASLAITLSLGMEARRKPFDCALDHDHRNADAVQEITAWSQWLTERGVKAIILVGEGTGALQVAMEAERPDPAAAGDSAQAQSSQPDEPAIAAFVLVFPPPTGRDAAADYRNRFGADLEAALAEARRIATEAGEDTSFEVPGFLACHRARVTAGALLDAYDGQRSPEIGALLAKRRRPALVFLGVGDARRAALGAVPAGSPADFKIETEILSTGPQASGVLLTPEITARIAAFSDQFAR